MSDWVVAAILFAAGIPAAIASNRYADRAALRENARRTTRLRGRTWAVLAATPPLMGACALAFDVPRAIVAAFYCAVLIGLAAVDAEQHIVPNRVVLPAAGIVLVAQTAIEPSVEWIAAALATGAFFFVAALAYPGGMGMGDVKLGLLLGAMLGAGAVSAVAIGLVAALVPSIAILIRQGARGRKTAIPLVPFLALGGLVALFAGRAILHAYLGTL